MYCKVSTNPDALKVYVIWTMGSLGSVTWEYMKIMAGVLLVGLYAAIVSTKQTKCYC